MNHILMIFCLSMLLICASAQAGQTGVAPALQQAFKRGKHEADIRGYWQRYYTATDAGKKLCSGIPYYPTEPAIVFLSAWQYTGEDKYREGGVTLLDFAHSRENADHLLVTEQGFNRDTQARQIYNFYTAYKLLGERKYLGWADACAQALIDHLPRREHVLRGRSYALFAAGYCKDARPYQVADLKCWIDVNQNAELALAYTLLYHEPRSAFYKSAKAKDIAINEMEAGLAIQHPETGAIPVAESEYWLTRCDTTYGAYSLFSWTWLNTMWKNSDWDKHIVDAGKWLATFSTGKGKAADRFYPTEGDALSAVDVWCRVPGLWKAGFAPDLLIDQWFSTGPSRNSAEEMAHIPLAYFHLMGIPPEFYLPPRRP